MQSSLNNLTALAKKGPVFSREFDALIRAIGECKSKAEEDAIITKEVEILKPRLKDPKMDKRWLKELLIRLIYVEMLGHDASWAHVKALQACSETGLITKKVAVQTQCMSMLCTLASVPGCMCAVLLPCCPCCCTCWHTASRCDKLQGPEAKLTLYAGLVSKKDALSRLPIWPLRFFWTTRVTPSSWW